jgi:hypothetical protein
MKKILVLASALIFTASVTVFGQTQQKPAEKTTTPKTTTTTSTVKQEPAKTTATPQSQKTMITSNQLPKTAQDYLTKTYPGKKVDQAFKVTEGNGTVNYVAQVGNMMLHFDAAGKFLKESKMEEKPAATAKPATGTTTTTTTVKSQPAAAPKKEAAAPAKK